MAIEDDEPKDREVWSNVARFWYNKAADKSPTVGRLYHHLAILARPYTLEQLSLYARSLTCVTPFESARGSIMTLFNPVLQGRDNLHRRASSLEILFIRAHAILFTSQILSASDRFNMTVDELEKDGLFDKYITKAGARFRELGAFAAISNIAALFEYGTPKQGNSKPMVRLAYEKAQIVKERASNPESGAFIQPRDPFASGEDIKLDSDTTLPQENEVSTVFISQPSRLASITLGLSLNRTTDKNVYPLVHVYLVFIWSLIIVQEAWRCFEKDVAWGIIERDIPWLAICFFLNALAGELHSMTSKIFAREFPHSGDEKGDKEKARPLPEDFVLRGQMYSQWYFPSTWFTNTMVDDDERTLELPSMVQPRMERILWLGHRIASVCYTSMR